MSRIAYPVPAMNYEADPDPGELADLQGRGVRILRVLEFGSYFRYFFYENERKSFET